MLKLKSIEIVERKGGKQFWNNQKIELDNYNLLIGPNATGKSKFFRRLDFLKEVHSKERQVRKISTEIYYKVEFLIRFHFYRI